ncbi:hypothetical protein ZWY2020_008431 [Hordeum vulgare]|nr:hypothetical protein ZWY2020_008431 [Hordeum vulgare]
METLQISSKTHTKKLHMPSFVLALVLLISLDSLTISCTEQERGSLPQFLVGLSQNGGLAASWENGTDCCKWEGITCRQDRTVTHVLLPFKGLEGNISRSLGILDALQHLDLSHNSPPNGRRRIGVAQERSQSLMSALTSSMEHSTSCPLRPCPGLSRY